MALSNEYLAAMAKDNPERAERLGDNDYRMPNLDHKNRSTVDRRQLNRPEIELFDNLIFGPQRTTKT